MAIERYIAGGILKYTPVGGTEREIGEVQDVKLKINTEYKKAFNKDKALPVVADKVPTKVEATISFKTQNISKENLAMFLLAEITQQTFSAGDTLPDGTVAASDVTVDVIKAAQNLTVKGKLVFVADSAVGTKSPVLEVPVASITPVGDLPLMSEDFANLEFEGEVLQQTNGEYFTEYLIPKAA